MAKKPEEEAVQNRTLNLGAAAPPAPPAAPAPAKQPAAPAPATQPAAPAAATNDRYRTGVATRGEGGVSLEDQAKSMEGYELIGFKGDKPLYEKADSLYSSQVKKLTPEPAAPTAQTAQINSTLDQAKNDYNTGGGGNVMLAGQDKTLKPPTSNITFGDNPNNVLAPPAGLTPPEPSGFNKPAAAMPAAAPSVEALREQYQKDATAARQEIEQKYKQPEQPKYFSKEYANQFMAAQESANQRAKERIAYGGQPVRDTSNSMAFANKAAAAMRAEAARPELATKEDIETSGLDKATQQRLRFGVGENGESVSVTPDYLKNYMASKGITKRPGPNFNNPFSGASKPSNRLYRRPGL